MSVEREVVITLNVASGSKTKAAASAARVAIQGVSRAAEEAAKKSAKMQETLTKAEEQASSDRLKVRLKAIDEIEKREQAAAKSEKKRQESAAKSVQKAAADEVRAVRDSENKKAAARQIAAAKAQDAMDKVDSAQAATAAAGRTAVDGMVTLTGGLLTLGLVSEDSTEKLVKGLLKIQGGVNSVKGGLDIFFGMRDAMKAWHAWTVATTTANNALAVSNQLVAASGAGIGSKAAGSVAGKVAGGAAGSVAASAIGGAGGSAAVATGGAGLAALAGTAATLGAVALVATSGIQMLRRGLGDTSDSSEDFLVALWTWRKASKDAAASTVQLSKAEDSRQKRLSKQSADNSRIQKVAQFQTSARASRSEIQTKISNVGASDADSAENERLRAIQEIGQAEAGVAAAQSRADERKQVQRQMMCAGLGGENVGMSF